MVQGYLINKKVDTVVYNLPPWVEVEEALEGGEAQEGAEYQE